MTDQILVLGGTGTIGRRVVRQLGEAGVPARAASRTAGDVHLDLAAPDTWPAALDGVAAAFLVEPGLGADADPVRLARFATDAAAAGVGRLVLLSTAAADREGHPLQAAERAVRHSGVRWTVLRVGWFAQNFGEKWWRDGILAGELRLPTGDGRTAFVDADDIAAVAVAALTGEGHDGETYELTGPRSMTLGEAVATIAAATGRSARHVDVDVDTYVADQLAAGATAEQARLMGGLLDGIRKGWMAAVGDGVERALGRPPRAFERYVEEAAANGAWS